MHPVSFEADYKEEHNRWTTGFRLILAIPWVLVFLIYAIGSLFVTLIAWFALVILARYPEWARNYNTGFVRYYARFSAWAGLQTDEWPPFGFGEEPAYPVRMNIVAPERQSRLKVFFRLILAIPAFIVGYAMSIIQVGCSVLSWMSIVFRGYKPRGAHDAYNFAFTYSMRLAAYAGIPLSYYGVVGGLLVDDYPPIGEEGPRRKAAKQALPSGAGSGAAATPAEAAPPTEPPPPPPPAAGA